ncbi:MAG: 1-deoxy-D-xylulose-5-phosphate reductoisomerase [Ignavibacteria bacterium]|jgi:1-deoxy-D-xylulose-5-phosphate reductoisomerase|nr:1-deoxy-D-xylulose-5-phosphate reductoisomerase [Ignavibacteria bacterium]
MKTITILGSTGSIGTQTLDVISAHRELYCINYLTTDTNIHLLDLQCSIFQPLGVVINNEISYKNFIAETNFKGKILCGSEGIIEAAADKANDLVVVGLVGFAGVRPTLEALRNGTDVAIANKEVLVTAGRIITSTALEMNAKILPIDSEHSAIFQCLQGERLDEIERLILTASGGPFLNYTREQLEKVTVSDALNHPNWKMGNKVTIDSSTMMNKGFEVIEAYWLFEGLTIEQLDVVIHPQSIIHSMVQFKDGSMKAQLCNQDMRIPISYSLTYPQRLSYDYPRLSLKDLRLDFVEVDKSKFSCLWLAVDALKRGGDATIVVNAANEIAVATFLRGEIKILRIPDIIQDAVAHFPLRQVHTIEDINACDMEVKEYVISQIKTNYRI